MDKEEELLKSDEESLDSSSTNLTETDEEKDPGREEHGISEDDDEDDYWHDVFQETIKDLNLDITDYPSVEEALNDDVFVKAVSAALRDKIQFINKASNFFKKDEIFRKISKTQKRLMKKEDYDEDEALKAAWKNRKVLIKGIIKEILEEDMNSGSENNDPAENPINPTDTRR